MRAKDKNGIAVHTPGQSKGRNAARAELRSKVLSVMTKREVSGAAITYVGTLTREVNASPQAVVMALTLLAREGEVVREDKGVYRLPRHEEL